MAIIAAKKSLFYLIIAMFLVNKANSDEIPDEPPVPSSPYAFGYAAGRYPGHIDRTHSEVSDGSGTIQGSFSYVDPRHQIRTVSYIADKNGFHPLLNNNPPVLPQDTVTVARAKQRHHQLYNELAANNKIIVPVDSVAVSIAKEKHFNLYRKIAEEHAKIAQEFQAKRFTEEGTARPIY